MGGETIPTGRSCRAQGRPTGSGRAAQEGVQPGGPLQHLLLRYTLAMLTQMAQTAVCNRHHTVDQQLCRWLLLSLDRLPADELTMTQELIANMLGVRREGVTEAQPGNSRARDLINYNRGHIKVLDRNGLEARVCECYDVVRKEFRRSCFRHPGTVIRSPLKHCALANGPFAEETSSIEM